MYLVGLTGGISTGKSTVSKMFTELNCPVIDADLIAREVVEPKTRGWTKIKEKFGNDVFQADGQLDREKLGQIIFREPTKRRLLNSIVHPEIYRSILWKLLILFLKGHQFVILDLPLLFETAKMVPYMTYTVVVGCSSEQQLDRLRARNNLSKEEARQRINSQMSLDEKCQRATYTIDNSQDIENTRKQVFDLYRHFCGSYAHWKLRTLLLSVLISGIGLGYFLLTKL